MHHKYLEMPHNETNIFIHINIHINRKSISSSTEAKKSQLPFAKQPCRVRNSSIYTFYSRDGRDLEILVARTVK